MSVSAQTKMSAPVPVSRIASIFACIWLPRRSILTFMPVFELSCLPKLSVWVLFSGTYQVPARMSRVVPLRVPALAAPAWAGAAEVLPAGDAFATAGLDGVVELQA